MDDSRLVSIAQLREFLKIAKTFSFTSTSRKEKYQWMNEVLNRFRYFRLRPADKSQVKTYILRMTGLSRVHLKRLIKRKKDFGRLKLSEHWGKKNTFPVKYGPSDIALLARVDNAHNRLNGQATKKILLREYGEYHKTEFENLKNISVSRIYDLRKSRQYISQSTTFNLTPTVARNIGQRAKPQPHGKPGYLRVDSVHQGDRDGEKGVYYVNLIDEVLQWELLVCVEGISERFFKPALGAILTCFPFVLQGFHSDNGSEYINQVVADILNRMTIRQTKSRSRHSNDNALVEGKNGSIVRKWFGRNHIPRQFASLINEFCQKYLNIYLNFHRPCGFAQTRLDHKGKQRKTYPVENYLTPYQKFKSLETPGQYLAPGRTIAELDDIQTAQSDTEFAERMQQAKTKLFKSFHS